MATKKDTDRVNEEIENSNKGAENKSDSPDKTKSAGKKQSKSSGKSGTKAKKSDSEKEKSESKEPDTQTKKTLSVEEKLAESQEKYLRLSAEFDNYRKRTLKEKIDLTKSAGETILVKLLPVMDDFERALQIMESASDCKAMKEGIDLIYVKFLDFLKTNGVKEIEAEKAEFDTDLHEAITKIPAPEKKLKGKVVDVIQKGYFLNEKVMRYAKVVIGE